MDLDRPEVATGLPPRYCQCPAPTTSSSGRVEILAPFVVAIHCCRHGPKIRSAHPEIRMLIRLVPEHLVLQLVRLRIVVNHQALEVLRTLVHHLTKRIEVREHARVLLVEFAPVTDDRLAQNEHEIDIRPQIRRNTDCVLHGDDKHRVDVAPVHKEIADVAITNPTAVIQTVVEDQEVPRIDSRRTPLPEILGDPLGDQLLALQDVADDQGRILLVDEGRGDGLTVEHVRALCARNHGAHGDVLVMPEEILHQEGLAGLALAD